VDHNNSYCVQPRYNAAGFHINLNIKKVFNNRIEDSRKGIHEKKPKAVSKPQVTFKGKASIQFKSGAYTQYVSILD